MWLELVTAYAPTPSGIEMPGQLRRAFAIAQWGYGDPENLATGTENGTATESAQGERERGTEDRDTALPAHVTDRDHERTMVGHVLDPLEVTEPRADVVSSVIAMVEGSRCPPAWAVSRRSWATELAITHVTRLRPAADRPGRAA